MRKFTDAEVRLIRTADAKDYYLSRLLKSRTNTVRNCRVGITYKDHPVQPDTKPRTSAGRYPGERVHRPK